MKKAILILVVFFLVTGLQAQTLDVMTYNIRYDNPGDAPNNWDNRKDFLISQLRYHAPDVFGTQEGLVHQLKDIDQGLANYSYFGAGRDNGDEKGEFTAIFYNTDKLKLLSESTFWLSPTPDIPSKGWDAALPRICTYGIFENLGNGKRFMVFNTHFDHVGTKAREESSKLILEKMGELNPGDLPVVLCGDFNLESDSEGVQVILGEMEDAHIAAGPNAFGPDGTFNGFHFDRPVKGRIDYIFVSPRGFEVLKSGILSDSKDGRYPSDHLPVMARLKFTEQ